MIHMKGIWKQFAVLFQNEYTCHLPWEPDANSLRFLGFWFSYIIWTNKKKKDHDHQTQHPGDFPRAVVLRTASLVSVYIRAFQNGILRTHQLRLGTLSHWTKILGLGNKFEKIAPWSSWWFEKPECKRLKHKQPKRKASEQMHKWSFNKYLVFFVA